MRRIQQIRLSRPTVGFLFTSILIFASLSYWCVGILGGVERNIQYFISKSEQNIVVINNEVLSNTDGNKTAFVKNLQPRLVLRHKKPRLATRSGKIANTAIEKPKYLHLNTIRTNRSARYRTCFKCFNVTFDYLIENNVCPSTNYTIVYLVFTKYSNIYQRNALRNTWLSDVKSAKNQSYVFVTGKGPENDTSYNFTSMFIENKKYQDLLLVDFVDSYSNLTYKTIMAFQWVSRRCSHASFVMKVDDDVWVNKPTLMARLRKNLMKNLNLGGFCFYHSLPFRDKKSKYYASVTSYPEASYPPFCSGTAYLTKISTIQKILQISPNVPFFHLEDVYIALCLRELGLTVMPINGFNVHKFIPSSCLNQSPVVITSHGLIPVEMEQIWRTKCDLNSWSVEDPRYMWKNALRENIKAVLLKNNKIRNPVQRVTNISAKKQMFLLKQQMDVNFPEM